MEIAVTYDLNTINKRQGTFINRRRKPNENLHKCIDKIKPITQCQEITPLIVQVVYL